MPVDKDGPRVRKQSRKINDLIRFFDRLSGAPVEEDGEEEEAGHDQEEQEQAADTKLGGYSSSVEDSEEEDERRLKSASDFPLTRDGIRRRIELIDDFEKRSKGTKESYLVAAITGRHFRCAHFKLN